MPAPHRRTRQALVGVAIIGALALAGCSRGASTNPTSDSGAAAPAPAAADEKAAPPGGVAADNAQGSQAAPPAQPDGQAPVPIETRSIIYTGSITVKVDKVPAAADKASTIAVGSGGVVGADTRTIDADRSEATLVLRVPAEKFGAILDQLAGLGTEQSRAVQSQDVTDTLVDLDARVATQEASVARVRDLLARAQTIGEIVSIESELTRRQADLESLKQRREKLSGLVALATITLNLHGPAAPVQPNDGFLAGLRSGWAGFLASVKVVLTVAGWLIPWLVLIGIPLWLVIRFTRRRRHRAAPVPAAAEPPTAASS